MSSAIDGVLTSEKLRNELIAEGRAQAEKYSWQRMAEETLAVYDQALDQ
jgi:glycosyltransferase involved in cell wall biosynthesis